MAMVGAAGEGTAEGEHESPISCKFRTEENSTWWHMARNDAKDLYALFCLPIFLPNPRIYSLTLSFALL